MTSVSIITPTLNAARYLAECIASIRDQGWPALQHVVVDGGSTDATEMLARDSGAVWLSRPGLNQAAAINTGLQQATGDIVAWLNSDDRYAPGAVAFVVSRFQADPSLEVVYGDCDVIDASGNLLWHERPGPYRFERLLGRGNYLAQPSVFFRRSVFDRIGWLDESLDFGMDYELWLRLRSTRVEYVPRVLSHFRWHSSSKTANNLRANWRDLLLSVRRHGGGWTPALRWAYARAQLTHMRVSVARRLFAPR